MNIPSNKGTLKIYKQKFYTYGIMSVHYKCIATGVKKWKLVMREFHFI